MAITTAQTIYNVTPGTIAITLNGLANATGRQSAVVDNTVDKAIDALVQLQLKNGTGTGGSIDIYAYGTADGTLYTGGTGITDIAYTPTAAQVLQLRKLDSIITPASGLVYNNMFSIAAAFGTMPRKWGMVVHNNGTGTAFDATAGNFSLKYSIVNYQSS